MIQSKMMEVVYNLCCESTLKLEHPELKFEQNLNSNSTSGEVILIVAGLLQRRFDLIAQTTGQCQRINIPSGIPTLMEIKYYMEKLAEALPQSFHQDLHFSMFWHPNKHFNHVRRVIIGFAELILKIKQSIPIIAEEKKKQLNLKKQLAKNIAAQKKKADEKKWILESIERTQKTINDVNEYLTSLDEEIVKMDSEIRNCLFEQAQQAIDRCQRAKERLEKIHFTRF